MRVSGVLIHEPPAHSSSHAQCAETVWSLWSQNWKTLQVKVPGWFPIKITRNNRCFVFRRRYHHGLIGAKCVIVGTVLRKMKLVLLGTMLCLHDKEDWPWPMTKQ